MLSKPEKQIYSFFFHSLEKTEIDFDPFLIDDLHTTLCPTLKEQKASIYF